MNLINGKILSKIDMLNSTGQNFDKGIIYIVPRIMFV